MYILPDQEQIQYSGRIDFSDPKAPEFVYPCSSAALRFTVQGGALRVDVTNRKNYWDNYLGYILDGEQGKLRLEGSEEKPIRGMYTIAENLEPGEHSLLLFKRQDSCHTITLHGFEVGTDEDVSLLACPPKPERRIEVYGDSVSAGEVSEAVDYVGKPDPEWHQGELSNSWYSYAWMTARKLNAQIHDIAQGGISLIDGIGWFAGPEYVGMESVYDKIQYNPAFGITKRWDFSLYRPQVVIIAIGQNDSNPYDFMKEDYDGAQAAHWRENYGAFVRVLRSIYPETEIVLATTLLNHDPNWDRSIGAVCESLKDPKVHHFLYKRNGRGTPGHIRIPEAEEMASELAEYIETLGIAW